MSPERKVGGASTDNMYSILSIIFKFKIFGESKLKIFGSLTSGPRTKLDILTKLFFMVNKLN